MDTKFVLQIASNGSIHVIPEDKPTSLFSATVILICFILGFTSNAVVSLTIIFDKSLRNTPFNLVVLYLSAASFIDCSLNESCAFMFAVSEYYRLQTSWCKLSSAVSLLSLILHTTAVLFLCAERLLSLTGYLRLLRSKIRQISLVAGGGWLLAVVLVIPIVCDISPTRFFRNRNACGIVPVDITYAVLLFLLGFLLPWLGSAILILRVHWQPCHTSSEHMQVQDSHVPLKEQIFLRISFTVVLLYSLLVVPHIIMLTVSHLTATQHYLPVYSLHSSKVDVIDSIFNWTKYQYNIILPIVILIFHKNLRKQCELLFCFWHYQNSITDLESLSLSIEKKQIMKQRKIATITPVLFATSDGLCLRITSCLTGSRRQYTCSLCDLSLNNFSTHNSMKRSADGNRKNVRFATTVNEIPPSESRISSGNRVLNSSSRTFNDTFIISK